MRELNIPAARRTVAARVADRTEAVDRGSADSVVASSAASLVAPSCTADGLGRRPQVSPRIVAGSLAAFVDARKVAAFAE